MSEKRHTMDYTLDYLVKNGIEPTVENYVALNWMGDQTLETLEGEWLAEVEELVAAGKLLTN